VGQFAREVVGPRVRHMDEEGCLDPLLLQQMFNQGVSEFIELKRAHHMPAYV
jgi:hypothetical protein